MNSSYLLAFILILLAISTRTTISFPQSLVKIPKNTSQFAHQNILSTAPTKQKSNKTSAYSDTTIFNQLLQNTIDSLLENYLEENETISQDYKEYSYELELDSDSGEEDLRKKLCPHERDGGSAYLYDNTTKVCGKVGEKGHCGTNMVFRVRPEINSTVYGYCECNFEKYKLPLVYHGKSNMCYSIYTQAYCPDSQWLIFDQENKPSCEPSLCRNGKNKKILKVPLNGNGPCVDFRAPSNHCSTEEVVQFGANSTVPTCGIPVRTPSPRLLSPISQNNCRPGSFLSFGGTCRSSWTW